MTAAQSVDFKGYQIVITEEKLRFTARISRKDGLVRHDGRSSEVWASASCGSHERAIATAMKAIDSGQVE